MYTYIYFLYSFKIESLLLYKRHSCVFTRWNKILRSSKWNLYENLEFFNNPVTLSDIAYSPRAPVFHHLIPNYTLVPSAGNIERQASILLQIRRENN